MRASLKSLSYICQYKSNIDQWLTVTADLQTLAYLFTMPVMSTSESSESLLSDIPLLRMKKITVKQ